MSPYKVAVGPQFTEVMKKCLELLAVSTSITPYDPGKVVVILSDFSV